MNSRFMHRNDAGLPYQPGRRHLDLPDFMDLGRKGSHCTYKWTPWPESIARRAQQAARIGPSEIAMEMIAIKRGDGHLLDKAQLQKKHDEVLLTSVEHDFSAPTINMSLVELQAASDFFEACFGNINIGALL